MRAWCEGTEAYLYRSEGALGASMGSLGLNGVWLRVGGDTWLWARMGLEGTGFQKSWVLEIILREDIV